MGDIANMPLPDALRLLGVGILVLAVFGVTGALALLIIAAQQIARIDIPEDADFFETLQLIPITVPLALDLLDMAFDVFSAPLAWLVLELLGLKALQAITIVEGLIPGTQLIPTMTIAWFVARVMKNRQPKSEARDAIQDELEARLEARYQSRLARGDSADRAALDYQRRALPAGSREYIEGEFYEQEEEYPASYSPRGDRDDY